MPIVRRPGIIVPNGAGSSKNGAMPALQRLSVPVKSNIKNGSGSFVHLFKNPADAGLQLMRICNPHLTGFGFAIQQK